MEPKGSILRSGSQIKALITTQYSSSCIESPIIPEFPPIGFGFKPAFYYYV
ncbi:hypothetical protein JCM19232_2448 [Vibrio ishigakensis]|uniref:Uncharacterized protein n=1 Tax=Vibrio ishigakensis TaxID=1481914 RepID=A0A0B8PK53_9VIBR|nr:hypothetical protein JCM19232_2448 [Vibrio ishigakensis]